MNKKLYIFYFFGGDYNQFAYYWSVTQKEAINMLLTDYNVNIKAYEAGGQLEDFEILHSDIVPDAVNRQEVQEAISRYIIKPLSK